MKTRSQLTIEECLKPHFKATLFLSYLKYIKLKYPNVNIELLFKDTPLSEKNLMDSSLWVSIKFERKFMENIALAVGKNISYDVGKFGASDEVLGKTFKLLFSLPSIYDLISNLAKLTGLFNKVVTISANPEKTRNLKFKLTPENDNLDLREQQLLLEAMEDMTANVAGYYEAIANLKGYINATVRPTKTGAVNSENAKFVELDLGVLHLPGAKKSYTINAALILCNLGVMIFASNYIAHSILFSLTLYFCNLFVNEKKQSLYFSTEGQEALTKIEIKNQKLQESSLTIERKLLEFEVINKLLNESVNNTSINKTAQLATDSLVEKLGYDRAFLLLKNESTTSLSFQCQTGAAKELLSILEKFNLPISEKQVFSEYQFSFLYNNQKSILVNDITAHIGKLNDPVSIQLLKLSGTNSFICVPVAAGNNKYGLLIADKTTIESKLSESDVTILENMANQIGLALQRIELKAREMSLLNAYSKFVPFSSIKLLGHESVLDLRLGDFQERNLTVLFCDIRNFTKMCETMAPQDILLFLNSYIGKISPAIQKHNGFIDKFIGDCIMAIFTNPNDAINAAVEMQKLLWSFNISNRLGYRKAVEVAIGIHSGKSIFGPVGYGNKMELTVLSDNVNIASRIGNLNKNFETTILVSGDSFKNWTGDSDSRYLGSVSVRGRSFPVSLYEILPDVNDISYEVNDANEEFLNPYIDKIKRDYSEKLRIKDQLKSALILKDIQDFDGAKRSLMQLKAISDEPIIDYQLESLEHETSQKKAS